MNTNINQPPEISEELLNAFVDDELDAAEKARLLNRMTGEGGGALRERVCQLWQIREMMRHAYPRQELSAPLPATTGSRFRRYSQALAASVVLTTGALLGWFAHEEKKPAASVNLAAWQLVEGKIILHIASADPERLKTALDEAEELSQRTNKSGKPMQIELVANEAGLSLFRADVSPYAARIDKLSKAHGNISFLACNNTIRTLSESGTTVQLLPHVEVTRSAVELIMAQVKQGWTYLQV